MVDGVRVKSNIGGKSYLEHELARTTDMPVERGSRAYEQSRPSQ